MLKVQEIREIIRLVDQSSINEFVYENEDSTISIKKANTSSEVVQVQEPVVQTEKVVQAPVVETKPQEVKAKETKPAAVEETTQTEDVEGIEEIVSPMVGTFYRKPSPESDSYVEVNSKIEADTVVCIVEAMKLFNEIEAEMSGEIVEILVEDGELVEYGQPLFKVKTT